MDVASLSKLYTAEGPFVSLYLDSTSATEDAAQQWDTRWKNVLRELDDAGVDEATRDALSAARGDHALGDTRVLIASHGHVHLATSLPEPPPRDLVRVGPLPHLLPLVDALTMRVPHIVVLADRRGANVIAYTTGPDPALVADVESDAYPVQKTGVGGWSSRRYDETVENNWEESAGQVAALVERVDRDVHAAVIIASGDERALQLLRDQLPPALTERYRTIAGGGRARDGGDEVIADEVVRVVSDEMAAATLALLEKFSEERGQRDRACEGLADTVAALRMAQVGTLLLTDAFEGGTLWFGPEPQHLGATRDELEALGVDRPEQADAADVLLRAALGSAAEVRLLAGGVEQAPREGVGALLRYTVADGTTS